MKFTISRKILAGFLLVIIVYSSALFYADYKIKKINSSYTDLINLRAKTAILAGEMKAAALEKVASFRGYIINGDPQKLERIAECDKSFNESRSAIEKILITDQGKAALKDLVASNEEYNKLVEEIKLLKQDNRNDEINKIVSGDGVRVVNSIIEDADTISMLAQKLLTDGEEQQKKESESTVKNSLIINILAILTSIILALIIARIISKPLIILSRSANRIAEGDLTLDEISISNHDEVGSLAESFNTMLGNLKKIVTKVKTSSEIVSASAQELMAGSEVTAASSEEISAAVQNIAANIESLKLSIENISSTSNQLSAGIDQTSDSMGEIGKKALKIDDLSKKGQDSLLSVVEQMNIISGTTSDSVEIVKELGEMSKKVENIISIINNISSQTNLLALNAAIEAARAGEHGKGFSVVADEVRKLADQSQSATIEISDTIKAMNSEIEKVIDSIQIGSNEVSKGSGIVQDVSLLFKDISAGFESILSQVQEVSTASEQMASGVEEVAASIEVIVQAVSENSSNIQNVTASIEEQTATVTEISEKSTHLSQLAIELDSSISVFKTA